MKFGSTSFWRKEALDGLLQRLYEELLKESVVKKAFLITEEQYFECGNKYTHFKINDIPIREEIYTPPKLDVMPFHENKFTLKERVKILFKGNV